MSRRTSGPAVALRSPRLRACRGAGAAAVSRASAAPRRPPRSSAWDIDVRPDFKGLPPGSGSVAKGQEVWDGKCASCHGTFGESNEVFTPLVGGTTAEDIKTGRVKSLTSPDTGAHHADEALDDLDALGLHQPRDAVERAEDPHAPRRSTRSLAYMLNLGDIVPADFVLSDRNIAEVQKRLPNRNGMTRDHGLWDVKGKGDVTNVACMKDCPPAGGIASALPEHARDAHGDLAEQNRSVGAVRGATAGDGRGARGGSESARKSADRGAARSPSARRASAATAWTSAIVGPAFKEVAAALQGAGGCEATLVEKVKQRRQRRLGADSDAAEPGSRRGRCARARRSGFCGCEMGRHSQGAECNFSTRTS